MKIQKGQSEFAYQRTDNTMAKRKSTKGKTTIYKLIYKAKGRVTGVPLKIVVILGASEDSVEPAPLVAPVVLI